jgi:hypothetical protein
MRIPKKVWIPVVVVAALVGAYAIAGFWWAPRYIRAEFTRFVAQDIKKQPRIGEVKVNPFTLRASIADLGIHEPSGERIVGFSRLDLDLSIRSVWKRGPVFDDITVEGPFVSAVVRKDRTLNLAELLPPDPPGATPGPPEPATKDDDGMPVYIASFTMRAGEAQYRDLSLRRPVQAKLQPVDFQLRDFSTRIGSGNAHTLSAVSQAGERLDWSGNFTLKPFTAKGRFSLVGLRAATLDDVLQETLPVELQAGTFGLGARYDVTAATSPLSGRVLIDTVDAKQVALAAPGRAQPDVVIADATVRGASIDLGTRRADLGKVAVTGAQLRAWMDAEGISLAALAGPEAPPGPAAADAGPPWTVALPEFALSGSRVDFEDRTLPLPARFALTGLTLNARGFTTQPGAKVAFDTAFGINAKGRLESSGTLRPDDLETRARVALRDLPMTDFEPYYADLVRLNLRGGSIDATGDLVYASPGKGAEPALAFKGDGAVRNLIARDRLVKRTFLRWRALRFNDIDYSGAGARLTVRSIDADAPFIDLVINADGTTNISDVLKSDGLSPEAGRRAKAAERAKHTARPETEEEPLRVDIGRMNLKGGSANFADLSVRPNFAIGLQTLDGSVTGLSSVQSSRAKVDIDGAVDKYAPVKITGTVNYLAAESYTDLAANFRNIELTTFNPYSGKFMGYRIEKGKLSIDTTYVVEDSKLRAQHKILVSQLKLGEKVKSPDATKLPVKLAVALLKDRDGNIRLDLPVSGTIDDPQFKLGPIIWKMFVNLLVKIITSPFTLLSSLFGGGPDVQFADFAPGRATLEPEVAERLASVRKALVERPGIEMEIPTAYSRELDAPALLATRWDARLADFAKGPVDTSDRGEYLDLLDGLYRAQTGQKPDDILEPLEAPDPKTGEKPSRDALREASIAALEGKLRSMIEVTDKDLEDLARARAKAVQEALLGSGEVDPLRVFLRAPAGIAPTANSVRLKLELKQ